MPLRICCWDAGTRIGNREEATFRCNTVGVKVNEVGHATLQCWAAGCSRLLPSCGLAADLRGAVASPVRGCGSSMIALPSVGLRATTLREPRQVRKEAALNGSRRAQRAARPAALTDRSG